MEQEFDGQEMRRLRLVTRNGHVEGQVRVNPRVSTLRYLNLSARSNSFIVMSTPVESSSGWNVVDGPLALAIDSVLFVQEVSDCRPIPADPAAAALYERCHLRMNVGDYAVEGFLHLPPGGNPIDRLNSDNHPFFALSAVSVVGHQDQLAAPFLAIKRSEIVAVQAIGKSVVLHDSVEVAVASPC